jgi:oxalate decarboxylase/phosphoglucose isomerase-like protein (cupin superfamily)
MGPEGGDHLWVNAESKDNLGSGGEFQIYVDPVTFPKASASFAKFSLGVGGALPVHRHDKTEEIGYFLAGEGVVTVYENGAPREIPVREGHVVYVPPGSWHTIKNTGQTPFSLVFATIPNEKKGLLSFFRRIGVRPGAEATPLSAEDFARLAAEHDLILRPPDMDE